MRPRVVAVPAVFDPKNHATPKEEAMQPKRTRFTSANPPPGESPPEYFVLGGDHLGASIARRLHADGHAVVLIDETRNPDDVPGLRGDPSDVEVLEDAGVEDASTVVVATPRDSLNLLVAQHLRSRFDVPEVFVLVHAPDRREILAETGHEPICVTSLLSEALLDTIPTASQEFDRTA